MTSSLSGGLEPLSSHDAVSQRSPAARDEKLRHAQLRRDQEAVLAVLAGDEAAFLSLARRWHGAMVRVARCYLASDALAEEAARSAWRAVLEDLPRWRPRSSLASFIFGILARRARERALLEQAAALPFECAPPEAEPGSGADRIPPDDHATQALRFLGVDEEWPAERLESAGALGALQRAVDGLPPTERLVFTIRDVVGCEPEETSAALELSEIDQRVFLHRARSRVRAEMASHFSSGG